MNIQKKCVHCHVWIETTVKISEGGTNLRHVLCPKCKKVADTYAIYQNSLPKDLLLFKPEAFMHLVFNSTCKSTGYLIAARIFLALVNTVDRVSTFCFKSVLRAVAFQVVEIFLLSTVLQRFLHYRRILYITTALSMLSIFKIFIFFSNTNIQHSYYQMCNIITLLMISKALSTYLVCSNITSLSGVIALRMISSAFFYSDFQI